MFAKCSPLCPRTGSPNVVKSRPPRLDSARHKQPSQVRFLSTTAAVFSSPSSTSSTASTASTEPTAAAAATSEQLRAVMRHLPHSVVVCTSVAADLALSSPSSPSTSTSEPRGMTMSSFTSLSLQPTPVVTFNIATPSRTLDAVSQSRHFNIHVLSGDAEGARVADWFRRGNAADLGLFDAGKMLEGCGCQVLPDTHKAERRQREDDEGAVTTRKVEGDGNNAPMLRGPGVLYALRCRLLADEPHRGLVRVRDHVVVLAEVVEIVRGAAGHVGDEEVVFGLVHADRQYRRVDGTTVDSQGERERDAEKGMEGGKGRSPARNPKHIELQAVTRRATKAALEYSIAVGLAAKSTSARGKVQR
ncbi:flavin reductase like domain-domain-containing protein [Coniella lustricola]|uniref:Flavin reductase like domain-domain-containing protein n=1 Tax=Coniella lustricola TaxID=2025994 RepID=A0A2T3ALB5_9PEZI|nr:flavin reductase like domain-domain-containing protein [Coniella lustricola]